MTTTRFAWERSIRVDECALLYRNTPHPETSPPHELVMVLGDETDWLESFRELAQSRGGYYAHGITGSSHIYRIGENSIQIFCEDEEAGGHPGYKMRGYGPYFENGWPSIDHWHLVRRKDRPINLQLRTQWCRPRWVIECLRQFKTEVH